MVSVAERLLTALASYQTLLVQFALFVVAALLVYAAGRLLVVPPVVRVVRARNRENPTLARATRLYAKIVVAAVALVFATVAAGFGQALQGSAIVVAAATLAVGVAGQEAIGNLVSGAFLVADPDFNVDDYIQWDGGEGTVLTVDFRVTRVRTIAGETVTVPNSQLTASALTTPYTGERYRLTERFGVRFDDDIAAAIRLAEEAARADDRVLDHPEPTVHAAGFGSTSVDLVARYWVGDPTETPILDVRSAYVRRVNERFADAGLTLNPPSQTELSGSVAVADDDDAPRAP